MTLNLMNSYLILPEMAEQEIEARLAGARVRPTRQRVLVLGALADEAHDATAQEIYARLRASDEPVGLATVYRTLALLTERGVVDELSHRAGESCYRLCSAGHHHHLVCSSCHRVEELSDCDLDDWLATASEQRGFVPTSHTLEVVGLCEACQAA
jgi:Fur family transcriptional regulator, ferric uptake regulator